MAVTAVRALDIYKLFVFAMETMNEAGEEIVEKNIITHIVVELYSKLQPHCIFMWKYKLK